MAAQMHRRAALVSMGAALALSATRANAQQYPARPIRWIIGYPPGGGTDVLGRLMGSAMSPELGQQFVFENRPGASTNLAAAEVVRSAPDGYTIMSAGVETLVYNPALYKKLSFDAAKDLRPVGLTARIHLVVTVKKDSTVKTAREFVDQAKAAAEPINYGSPGLGSPHHIAMERFAQAVGIKLLHVPYRGAAPVINDMMVGVIESSILDFAAGGSALKEGALRPLAVCSAKRLEALPDVPTVKEALGLGGFEAYAWQGVVAPAATPDDIIGKLAAALVKAKSQEAIQKRMAEIGLDPLSGGPAEFTALLNSEREIWWPVIRDLGLSLN